VINRGLKVGQEPHGGWTVWLYKTPDCQDEDWWEMADVNHENLTPEALEIEAWLEKNSPPEHDADFQPFGAVIQWNQKGEETALLFKAAFSGRW
jgi:hypothetical protein